MKDILQKLLIGTLALGLIPALWGFTHFAFGASPLDNPGVTADDSTVVWTGTHTNTAQSCFLAFNSVTDSNVTGAGQLVTVDFDTEVFDQGSDFASDTFTAPVTGKYNLSMNIRISGIRQREIQLLLELLPPIVYMKLYIFRLITCLQV